MIIDSHIHLDENFDGTCMGAFSEIDRQFIESRIDKGVVLHLESQPWSMEEFSSCLLKFPRFIGIINTDPFKKDSIKTLQHGIKNLGFSGLKLHPRLQEFSLIEPMVESLCLAAGELNVPVLIDAFPDGTHLMQGFSPFNYSKLASQCPKTKFIWAHMGGHYVLDFMMLAKRLENVYMDTSYSLLYYQTDSVIDNLIYCMRSMKFDKIFYGSDYPDRSIKTSLEMSIDILKKKGLTDIQLKKILFENANNFFKWG